MIVFQLIHIYDCFGLLCERPHIYPAGPPPYPKNHHNPMHPDRKSFWKLGLTHAQAAPRCGAKTRSGQPCRNPAMANGRCRMHGGKSLSGKDHGRYIHGAYTQAAQEERATIRALIQQAKALQGEVEMLIG